MHNDYVYIDDATLGAYISKNEKDFEAEYGSGILIQINDEIISKYESYLESLTFKHKNKAIEGIVEDELLIFLNGDKSVDETANAIQSRVSIYMSEMWG